MSFLRGAALALLVLCQPALGQEKLIKFDQSMSEKEARFRLEASGLKIKKYIKELNIYVTEKDPKALVTPQSKLHALAEQYASYVEDNVRYHAIGVPNDTRLGQQDGLKLLEAQKAWEITRGHRDVVVAVIDTGVDLDHQELKNQLWVNTGEVPGNGIDDDNNGYVDDVHGYDFNGNDGNPDDDNTHGTHVAGIIGAETNNQNGIAGVTWNVQIMALKFLNRFGGGDAANGVEAIIYAADNGADIINASWGGNLDSQSLRQAISYAVSKGVLVIAAAGNNGRNTDTRPIWPASLDVEGLISVASVDSDSVKSSFSNFGSLTVDLGAPGKDILSTVLDGGYERHSGTSMAAPMVAGTAALMLSVRNLGVLDLRNALFNATQLGSATNGKTSTGGVLKASLAVEQLVSGPSLMPARVTLNRGDTFTLSAFDIQGPLEFLVEDDHILSVSSSGLVTAKNGGVTSVSVKGASGVTHSLEAIRVLGASDPRDDEGEDDGEDGDDGNDDGGDDGEGDDTGDDNDDDDSDENEDDDEDGDEGDNGNPPGSGCSKSANDQNISSANASAIGLTLLFPLLLTGFRRRQDD